MAHLIVVNSDYTRSIFKQSFKLLNKFKVNPNILYPAIDFTKFDKTEAEPGRLQVYNEFFVSLNRYERKKNIPLAIRAFALFKKSV